LLKKYQISLDRNITNLKLDAYDSLALAQDRKFTDQTQKTQKLQSKLTSARANIKNHSLTHTAIDQKIDSDLSMINTNVSALVNEVWSKDKKLIEIEGELRVAKEQICIEFLGIKI
jgi:NAD-dependent SIR2 family protein deacetylase